MKFSQYCTKSIRLAGLMAGFALLLSLASCSGAKGSGAKGGGAGVDGAGDDLVTPAGQYPIIQQKDGEEPITLSVLTESRGFIGDWQANMFSQWLEKKTGVRGEYLPIERENKTERINTLIASGDLPDVMISIGLGGDVVKNYGQEGLFINLVPYIEKYGSVIKQVFAKKPVVKPMISDQGGNIYTVPRITECYHCFRGPKVWYYKPFVDKLGLSLPETTEDFYQFLKAIKEGDPNGNGIADEIPYTGSNVGWDNSGIIDFIAGSFLYAPSIGTKNAGLYLNGATVESAYVSDAYRDALRYMVRLYRDGLINDFSFTMNANDYKRTVEAETPIVAVAQSNYPGVFADYGKLGDRGFDFFPLAPLKGPNGVRYANLYTPYQGVISESVVTYKSKYPAVAFRWLETFMLPETTIRAQIGFENINWWKAPAGTLTSIGEPAQWVNYNPADPYAKPVEGSYAWLNEGPTVGIKGDATFGFPDALGISYKGDSSQDLPRGGYEEILGISSKDSYDPYSADIHKILPPINISTEKSDEATELRTSISSYMESESVKFIRGERDIESDWDNYVATIRGKLKLDGLVKIYQDAYDIEKDRWNF